MRRLVFPCFLLLVASCANGKAQDSQTTPTPPANGNPESASDTPAAPNYTGPLDEEAFKALHDLKSEEPPPRRGQMIDLAGGKAYLSLPEGATAPLPAVIVIHEWWGLNEHIKHWTDRLASDGYAALAVDIYDGKVASNPDEAMKYMKEADPARATQILRAAFDFLGSDPRVRATKRASIGWCFGGHWSLRTALAIPELDAAVIYYGRLVTDAKELRAIKAEILGIFGNRDQGIPPDQVNAFEAGLKEAGISATILRYDADHAFANPSGQRYDEKAASAAWDEVRKFLGTHLEGG